MLRRGLLAATIAALLGLAGFAAVTFAVGETTGTVTAAIPDQTITIPGTTNVQTYTIPTVTDTQTVTVTVTAPPPPPPPAGTVRYRKSADSTANVFGSNSNEEVAAGGSCYPPLAPLYGINYCDWARVSSDNTVCTLPKDPIDPFAGNYSVRFDSAANASVDTGSRCEIGKQIESGAFTDDYYHIAWKVEPGWGENNAHGGLVAQLKYESIVGGDVYVGMEDTGDYFYMLINSGACNASTQVCPYYTGSTTSGGFGPRPADFPGPLYLTPPGGLTRGVWHEFLIHVYWTPDANGVLEAWHKTKGQSTWTKAIDLGPLGSAHLTQYNIPTMQTGVQQVPSTASLDCRTITRDDLLLPDDQQCAWPFAHRFGNYGGQSLPGSDNDGKTEAWGEWCRASTLEVADHCFD